MGEADGHALLEQARAKLAELQTLAAEAEAVARARLAGGAPLTKNDVKALNRAASLARYVADCAHRAAWEPPRGRHRRGAGFALEGWRGGMLSGEHDRKAAELLREVPSTIELESMAPDWCQRVREWLEADAKRSSP